MIKQLQIYVKKSSLFWRIQKAFFKRPCEKEKKTKKDI